MKNISILVFWLLTISIQSFAQKNEINSIIDAYKNYTVNHLPEKIYVHTDKSTYINNEICWFKIYTLDGFLHQPLILNKVAYIELLNEQRNAIVQEKISLNNATGDGSIQLPADIPSGKYTLVAYTNWMKNFDPEFFFHKTITIINTQNKIENITSTNKSSDNISINVYPESGYLLNGINNTVGFSVTNKFGKGIAINGWLLNDKLDTITSIKTLTQGIGHFNFIPSQLNSYKIVITLNKSSIEKELPKSLSSGYALQIKNYKKDTITTKIHTVGVKQNKIYLVIHNRGIIKKAMQLTIPDNEAELNIPLTDVGDGINCFTLFDNEKNPVAERLFFKYPKYEQANIELESTNFKQRQKVNVRFNSLTNFDASLSIYKLDSLQGIDETNIQNYILLSSDLIGNIESPNSYFDQSNNLRTEAMDNLMLTKGWRRFSQENIFKKDSSIFSFLPEIGGNLITGKIINLGTNAPAKETPAYISVPSKNTVFKSAMSDNEGKIMFQLDEFMNNGQIIVQADSAQNSKNKIEIDNPFSGRKIALMKQEPLDIKKINQNSLQSIYRNVQVQNFYSPQNNNLFTKSIQDTNAFYYTPDRTYYLDDYARFSTLEEVIREYVTPVTLVKEKGKYQFYVYDEAYKQFFEQKPLVLLDGVIIKDIDKFLEYDPLKIRKLEVVSRVYYSGNLAYNGIINFTTYTGKLEGFEIDPKATVLDFKGLQNKRIFNAPVYENGDQQENRIPDFRQVLLWKPDLKIEKKQKISFFSSDNKGYYLISLQGLSKEGKILNQTSTFEVK